MGIVYQVRNTITGKSYVGQTIGELDRRKQHHHSKTKHASACYFHNALRKHGFENFEWVVLVEGKTIDELNILEPEYIEKLGTLAPNGYNLTTGGRGSFGYKPTSVAKIKMGDTKLGSKNGMFGKKHTKASKRKMSVAHTGKTHTDHSKAKMSVARMGNKNHMFGKKHTDSSRSKMSAAHTGQQSHTKLTKTEVLAIKDKLKYGVSGRALAKKFNVGCTAISDIKTGKTWRHLTN